VLEDVLDEYVSPEGARARYGVVLTGTLRQLDLELDLPATNDLRQLLTAERSADPGPESSN
jgi:N-methylhydantoinase B